ncbi:MAG TPA: EamA family transporter [Thermoleophilia bacterium]|nr:EamA family transporter [Thermoleophilia bacterium]
MSRKGWLLFVALCIMWGIPYLFIRVAVRDFSPPTLVLLRTAPAALLLLPLALRRGYVRPLLPLWRWILAFTVIELAVPWLLIARAEQHISSSMTGLLIATVPLMGAALYALVPGMERLDRRRLTGLIVGFVGIVALVGIDVGQTDLFAVAEVVLVALCYAIGPLLISRRLATLPGLGVVSVAVTLVAVAYAPLGLAQLPGDASAEAIASVVGLALFCTALAFLAFFELILEVGPSRSTVITYINPLVAVLLGVALLSEPFTTGIAVGLPLILLGSVLATRRSLPPPEPVPLTQRVPPTKRVPMTEPMAPTESTAPTEPIAPTEQASQRSSGTSSGHVASAVATRCRHSVSSASPQVHDQASSPPRVNSSVW